MSKALLAEVLVQRIIDVFSPVASDKRGYSTWIFHRSFKNSSGLVCIRAAIITTIFYRLPIIRKAPLQTSSMLRA